jgi:predicted transcriptional regulator
VRLLLESGDEGNSSREQACADLARRAEIRLETLSRLEKGNSTPDVDTVDKIIRVLERVEAKASP